ncbi:hypothetical protein LINPERPRIM_LOCUS35605 [Linum perenne]
MRWRSEIQTVRARECGWGPSTR